MSNNSCLVCKSAQEASRSLCSLCHGLTENGASELHPYTPERLLVKWEAGSLYLGRIEFEALSSDNLELHHARHEDPYVWIFVYEDHVTRTPAFPRLQHEDRQLARLPHPLLPSQLDRGVIEYSPYIIFEGKELALPLPNWRPDLPAHVLGSIFSKLSELVIILQSANIQRPVLDPYRIMIYWDEELERLHFKWLPLPDLGNYLYTEGFVPKGYHSAASLPSVHQPLKETSSIVHVSSGHHAESHVVTRGPLFPNTEQESQRETTVIRKRSEITDSSEELEAEPEHTSEHSLSAPNPTLKRTDEFELDALLDSIDVPSSELEDFNVLAHQLAEFEKKTRNASSPPEPVHTSTGSAETFRTKHHVEVVIGTSPARSAELTSHMHGSEGPDLGVNEALPPDSMDISAATSNALHEHIRSVYAHKEHLSALHAMSSMVDSVNLRPLERVAPHAEISHVSLRPTWTPPPASQSFHDPSKTLTESEQELYAHALADSVDLPTPIPFAPPETLLLHDAQPSPLLLELFEQEHKASEQHENSLAKTDTHIPSVPGFPNQIQIELDYVHNMRVQRNFPLHVTVRNVNAVMSHTHTHRRVRLQPVLPGCLVSPSEYSIHLDEYATNEWKHTFWITPIAPGDIRSSARLQVHPTHASQVTLPLPIRVQAATFRYSVMTLAIALLLATSMLPWLSLTQDWSRSTFSTVQGGGFAISLTLLLISLVSRWIQRPQQVHTHIDNIEALSYES